jgi:tetratricopeptide (TPR) repeat protein
MLGHALKDAGQTDQAVGAYRAAIAAEPDLVDAHWYLAQVLRDLERLDDAAAACRGALAIEPEHALARQVLGHLLLRLDRHREGLEELKQAEGVIEFPAGPDASMRFIQTQAAELRRAT